MNITSEDEALLELFENGKTLCVIMACATKDCTETEKIKNP